MSIMTPSEVLSKTSEKSTQKIASLLHKDMTNIGSAKLEALQNLAYILLPGKTLTLKIEAEAPRVNEVTKKVEVDTPRVKMTISRNPCREIIGEN